MALCKAVPYSSFNGSLMPVAYLSETLCNFLTFLKPNLCDVVIENKKYEFYVIPKAEIFEGRNIYYDDHIISLPENFYRKRIGYKEDNLIKIRTDVFQNIGSPVIS